MQTQIVVCLHFHLTATVNVQGQLSVHRPWSMGLWEGINQVLYFEAVDNSLRFSCDLIERNERFTISAHFDEKGDMINTWQIHSLVSDLSDITCTACKTYLCNVAQCRVSDFSNIPIFQFSIYFLFSKFSANAHYLYGMCINFHCRQAMRDEHHHRIFMTHTPLKILTFLKFL